MELRIVEGELLSFDGLELYEVVVNKKGDISHSNFSRIHESYWEVHNLSDNPPNPFFEKPQDVFGNWERFKQLNPQLELNKWSDVALQSKLGDSWYENKARELRNDKNK